MINNTNVIFNMTITGEKKDLLAFSEWFEEKSKESFNIEDYLRKNDFEDIYTKIESENKIIYRFFSKKNLCTTKEWVYFKEKFERKWKRFLTLDIIDGYETVIVSKQLPPKLKIDTIKINFLIPYQYQIF